MSQTYRPEWFGLFGVKIKIILGQEYRTAALLTSSVSSAGLVFASRRRCCGHSGDWRVFQLQICVLSDKFEQGSESEQAKSIIGVIGHVGHVDVDRIVDDRLEQLPAPYAGEQLPKTTWILVLEDCVRVQAASLPW